MSIFGLSIFDLSGAIISVFSVYCMLRKNMWYWYSSIVCNILWLVLFLSKNIYLSSALQVSYILFSLYGIFRWKQNKLGKEIPNGLDIIGLFLVVLTLTIAVWNTSYNSLYNIIEVFAVIFLVFANLLTAKENRKCWYFWIIGDILFAVFLWHSRIYAMFIIQFIFLGLSIWGLYAWKKEPHPKH